MSGHHVKILASLSMAFFVLMSLQNGGCAGRTVQQPAIEPLEGRPAKLNNKEDLAKASAAFEKGLLAVETVILKEGIRRRSGERGDNDGQQKLQTPVNTLRVCKKACETSERQCPITLIDSRITDTSRFEILAATSCKTSGGKCQVECTQNFLSAVAKITDTTSNTNGNENQEQVFQRERQEAVKGILAKEGREAELVLHTGILNFQDVAFEELVRVTLDQYKEYGVPEGPTRIVTASNNQQKCITEVMAESAECHRGAEKLLDFFFGGLVCSSVSAVQALNCVVDTVQRVCPFCPQLGD